VPDHLDNDVRTALDRVLAEVCDLPGVVALVTDRERTVYQGSIGRRSADGPEELSVDSVLTMFSTTKPVVATAVLQLVERGELDLDVPASRYVPALAGVQVLAGFTADGQPVLRAPRRPITTRMLLLHTAGFGYSDFHPTYARLLAEGRLASAGDATMAGLTAPLLFDPGDRWEYGLSMDWAGLVVEGVTGRRLRDVLATDVLEPLGMHDTAFTLTPAMHARFAPLHAREAGGGFQPLDYLLPQQPEIDMGGHGLYSTGRDFIRFVRLWLGDGAGADGRVLRPETIAWAARDGLDGLKAHPLPGVNRFMTRDVDLFPGMTTSWAYSFAVNDEPLPTGRSAGSLSWVGMANTYLWIDRAQGIGGLWAANLLPLADPVAREAFATFETSVYAALSPRPVPAR
jgi:methyl acetate hydrolase